MYAYQIFARTDHVELDGHGRLGFGADLAVVQPGVVAAGAVDGQRPDGAAGPVERLEAQVSRVGVPAGREDVQVRLSDPRHLPDSRQRRP